MTRYYSVVILINIVIAALFYFKWRKMGLSTKAFIFIIGFSTLISMSFPLLIGFFNPYAVIGIDLCIAFLAAYIITAAEYLTDAVPESVNITANEPAAAIYRCNGEETSPTEADDVAEAEAETEAVAEAEAEAVAEAEAEAVAEAEAEAVTELETDTEPETEMYNTTKGEGDIISEQRGNEDVLDLIYSHVSRGFDAKTEGKNDLAAKYFSLAVDLNPPADLKKMLVFDMYALFRELGQYQEAKNCLEGFQRNSTLKLPPDITREIKVNLKYIALLQEMLDKAGTPNLPFSKVPALIKISVEGKVNQWLDEAF